MPYAVIEKSGCGIVKDVAKLRIDCFLNPDDPYYDKCYVNVPVIPPEGYQGKVDKEGTPKNQKDYDAWLESLPHIWQNNPFHSHKIWLPKEPTDNFINEQIERTLTYFYNFHQHVWDNELKFIDEWKKVPFKKGSIRDVFIKGDPKDKVFNEQKVADVLSRVQGFQIGVSRVPKTDLNIGEKGTITIGYAAEGRASIGSSTWTRVMQGGTASGDGSIDTIQVYPNTTMEGLEVASFSEGEASVLTTRDNETIGTVTAGAPDPDVFTGLAMDVLTGDYIGFYSTSGDIEADTTGAPGRWYLSGDHIPCTDLAFYPGGNQIYSLYGTGNGGGGVTVTPETLALVITFYAPTVTAINPITVTPSTLTLVLTTYAPTVTVSPVGADWLGTWAKRVKLTIDSGDIDAALSNFPILLHISTSSGINSEDLSFVFDELTQDANRKKIAVTLTDGTTECYVEIEKWDDANEEAWLWVKVSGADSIASGADTDLYLYYDSAHADNDTYVGDPNDVVAESVWDANFVLVSHMLDDPDTSHIRDSTSNDNDATKTGANEPAVTTSGQIDNAQDFDGTDDECVVASVLGLGAANATIECWVYITGTSLTGAFIKIGNITTAPYGDGYAIGVGSTTFDGAGNVPIVLYEGLRWIPASGKTYGTGWHKAVLVIDGSGYPNIYLDGASIYSDSTAAPLAPHDYTRIGGYTSSTPDNRHFDGIIDEVRVSNSVRTAAWIKASYESERDDLLDWGSEEEAGGGVEVTPGLIALTITTYAPVIKLKVIPPTLTLSDTEYAPVLKLKIIPLTLTLSDTEYAPVLKLGIIPPLLALSLTTYAPTVTATGNQVVTPSTATLTLTEFAPVIGLKIIPPTLALSDTEYAPVIGLKIIPGTITLSDTEYAPVIKLGITPTTKALTLTTYAPTVSTPRLVTPPTKALTITAYAPTVLTPVLVTPTTKALSLTPYIPTALTPRLVTPPTLALTLTAYISTVLTPRLVTPSTLALILTTYAPTVTITGGSVLVIPDTLALLLTFYAPQLFGGDFPLPEGGGRYGTDPIDTDTGVSIPSTGRYGVNPTDTDTGTSVSTGGRYG